jgi:uncharacterized membrane protein
VSEPAVRQERDEASDIAAPRWPWIVGFSLTLLGFGVSAYLTYEHYTGSSSLTCPATSSNGVVNCLKVTTSPWSMEYGIPVAVLGLVFFAIMGILQSPQAWRTTLAAARVGRVLWCLVGLGSAVKLIYDELYKVHAICEWCTSVHIVTFLLFVATLFGTVSTTPAGGHLEESA